MWGECGGGGGGGGELNILLSIGSGCNISVLGKPSKNIPLGPETDSSRGRH